MQKGPKQIVKEVLTNPALLTALKLLLLFSAFRLGFFFWHMETISAHAPTTREIVNSFRAGVQLDLIIVFYLSMLLYGILFFISRKLIRWLIAFITTLFIALINMIDLHYFTYTKERLGVDLWVFINPNNNISLTEYLTEYSVALITTLVVSFLVANWINHAFYEKPNLKKFATGLLILFALYPLARGGFRSRPLRSADISTLVDSRISYLALNPTLLITESALNPISPPPLKNVEPTQLDLVSIDSSKRFNKANIILIIAESFGKEYTGLNHGYCESYTPLLNRRMDSSLVFHRCHANGLKSMDVVPAIFTGIPRLQDRAYIKSTFSMRETSSALKILGSHGYHTYFFHGADPNTMGFKSYLTAHGLDEYRSIDDYPSAQKSEDYDGNWGIYDLPYLQYVRANLSERGGPFFATIFTLSSHHPYSIPEKEKWKFPVGDLAIHQSIGYTDYAIDSFINSCSREPWYDNTIFIITADHSSENAMHAYRTSSGKYEVPLVIYSPELIAPGKNSVTMSHVDIMPTLFDLMHLPSSFKWLGKSAISNPDGIAVHFDNGHWHSTQGDWNLGMDQSGPTHLYNIVSDPNCLNDVLGKNQFLADSLYRKAERYTRQHLNFIQ